MLTRLDIKNFAIIDDLTLDFAPGLTVFSGETGAGKSIVIEALGFVLGARGDASVIKDGADKMCVKAEFESADLPDVVRAQYQLTADRFTLRRELDNKGKGKAHLDGRPVTVSALAQIGQHLVDFHGQHDHQSLLHSAVHLQLLDHFAKHDMLVKQVQAAYQTEQEIRAKLEALKLSAQEKERLLDLYAYQLKEIEDVRPAAAEDEQLEQTLPKLKHAGKLLEMAEEAYDELYNAEQSATSRATRAAKLINQMADLDENLAQLAQDVSAALVTLEDAAQTLGAYKEDMEVDPDALDGLARENQKFTARRRTRARFGKRTYRRTYGFVKTRAQSARQTLRGRRKISAADYGRNQAARV